jgi:hypothetical protein
VAPTPRAEAVPDAQTFQVAAPAPDDRPHETPVAPAPAAVLEPTPDSEIVRVEPQDIRPAPLPTRVDVSALAHNAPETSRVALELPPDSGLILVETTHVAPAVEETESARPRRVRPPRAASADEPLQMVETTHKDSTPPTT